jgi:methyl-accepting chemotaxis protein
MFRNLKVGTKLLSAFLLIAVIGAVVSSIGIFKINQVNSAATKLYEKVTVPLDNKGEIQ